jgi:hypothetical protein
MFFLKNRALEDESVFKKYCFLKKLLLVIVLILSNLGKYKYSKRTFFNSFKT